MLSFDHVVVTVADYDIAAATILDDHGLASVAGGRHAGHGTANRIVPLCDSYLELVAVVDGDEATHSAFGAWTASQAEAGDTLAAVCLRTDDIRRVADRLDVGTLEMSRRTPDGVELSWAVAGLDEALNDGFPFFVEWHVPASDRPGRAAAAHVTHPEGISWVELAGDVEHVRWWLGSHNLDIRYTDGAPGLRRVGIATRDGELILA